MLAQMERQPGKGIGFYGKLKKVFGRQPDGAHANGIRMRERWRKGERRAAADLRAGMFDLSCLMPAVK